MTKLSSILVVDDDADIVANFTDILADIGYETDGATNALAALEKAEQTQFDLVLIDYKMPDMDGATLFAKIRTIQPDVVAIMVTAYAGSDGVKRALEAGTSHVLRKPIDVPELLGLIGEAVG